jgi:hypothetical protein
MDAPYPLPMITYRLGRGRIRHETLPDETLWHVESIYGMIGPYLGLALETFEIGFMRVPSPEAEALVWSNIAIAWDNYHERYLDDDFLSDDEERALIESLVAISLGVQHIQRLQASQEAVARLEACYNELAAY